MQFAHWMEGPNKKATPARAGGKFETPGQKDIKKQSVRPADADYDPKTIGEVIDGLHTQDFDDETRH